MAQSEQNYVVFVPFYGWYKQVIAQCKKTTTVNKMNDRNKMPTAHSGTFACPYTRATASQAKEPEFLPTH
jgi:hypothetical protein